ncbi:MAG: hypothetical protein HZC25_01740 [Rhodospirillales bacterium]|nr:hypothetical protein [Rhodospirillales bacterium]
MKKPIALVLVAALATSGCAQLNAHMSQPGNRPPAEILGAAAGAAAGAMLGYHFLGAGLGKVAFAAAGAVVGATGGWYAGRVLTQGDVRRAAMAAELALVETPDANPRGWYNEETGHSGAFVPVSTYRLADGTLCRDFQASYTAKDEAKAISGTACQMSDGFWARTT